jgi:large subunit ribosomal protein L31
MKEGIHPQYRDVVFMDVGADFAYLTRSTARTKDTIQWKDGKEYPLYKVAISSASHPFYTGKQKFVDSTGRIEKFRQRYQLKDAASMLEALEKKKEEQKNG